MAIPVNTTIPTISGTAQVGQTLTASTGAWLIADIEAGQIDVIVVYKVDRLLRWPFRAGLGTRPTWFSLVDRARARLSCLSTTLGPWTPNGREAIASRLQAESYEVLVSFDNLKRLNCITFPGGAPEINPYSAPLGMLLIRAIA